MRRLAGGIPRGPFDGRSLEGRAYSAYLRALRERLGPLPDSAGPTLRAVGMVAVELEREATALQRALARRRVREANRTRRRMTVLRTQLLALERRLEELAAAHQPADFARALRMVDRG